MDRTVRRAGFTLIELMMVMAIISIIATVAIPKFADLIRKSSEGATKGNLGSLRGALSIYYGEMEGNYPTDDMSILLTSQRKYLDEIPPAKIKGYHADANVVLAIASNTAANLTDAGGWAYVNATDTKDWGVVLVNCTDTDTTGAVWTSY